MKVKVTALVTGVFSITHKPATETEKEQFLVKMVDHGFRPSVPEAYYHDLTPEQMDAMGDTKEYVAGVAMLEVFEMAVSAYRKLLKRAEDEPVEQGNMPKASA